MTKNIILEQLDFSGGPNSWFDMWQTHVDWNGEGNKDWETRKLFLDKLVDLFQQAKEKLKEFPHDYQVFLWVLESDSGQDCIYIHSKNPNEDDFPLKLRKMDSYEVKNVQLKNYLDNTGLQVMADFYSGEVQYYLFEKNVGVSLAE